MVSVKSKIDHGALAGVLETISRFQDVTIVAVTKHQSVESVERIRSMGIQDLGVNYTVQGDELREQIQSAEVRWHFIGQIQSRKARQLASYHLVQSLDRITVAKELNRALESADIFIDALVQVNIGEEPQKAGVMPGELNAFLEEVSSEKRLRIRGLMAMPPFLDPPVKRAAYFEAMRTLFEQYRSSDFSILSMGTTTDYEIALDYGSNMIRLGTMLFGSRPLRRHR